MMTAEVIMIGACDCETCGREYDFEATGAEYSDQCPACAAREEEASNRRDAIREAKDELDSLKDELADLLSDVAAKKLEIKAKKEELARLRLPAPAGREEGA